METATGHFVDRLCPWSRYLVRNEKTNVYESIWYDPGEQERYQFQHANIRKRDRLKIYEAHIGISSNEEKISTYDYFRREILPRIVRQGLQNRTVLYVYVRIYFFACH